MLFFLLLLPKLVQQCCRHGIAIALIGAGIGVAALGMGKAAESFGTFMNEIDLIKLGKINLAINTLALSFYNLSLSLLAVASVGFLAMPIVAASKVLGLEGTSSSEQTSAANTAATGANTAAVGPIELTIKVDINSPIMLDRKQGRGFCSKRNISKRC